MDQNQNASLALDSETLANKCVQICENRKAEDVMLFDVSHSSILADYYLICTGTSSPHINAISGRLKQELANDGVHMRGREGDPASQWVVLDYGTVLIHILDPERRDYYQVEDLWDTGNIVYSGNDQDEEA